MTVHLYLQFPGMSRRWLRSPSPRKNNNDPPPPSDRLWMTPSTTPYGPVVPLSGPRDQPDENVTGLSRNLEEWYQILDLQFRGVNRKQPHPPPPRFDKRPKPTSPRQWQFSKDRTVRQGKNKETDLSRSKTTPRKTDTVNRKGPTTEEIEVQTLYNPFFFWVS